jgi:hypothetical protein
VGAGLRAEYTARGVEVYRAPGAGLGLRAGAAGLRGGATLWTEGAHVALLRRELWPVWRGRCCRCAAPALTCV